MLCTGLIGFGYWGPNLARNLFFSGTAEVKTVCDLSQDNLVRAKKMFPSVRTSTDAAEIFSDPEIEAVVISTQTRFHYDLAKKSLEAGKHVLLTKPISETAHQAAQLRKLAHEKGRVLMVDHTFIYTPAVRKLREMVQQGELGDLLFYDSSRINLGLFQQDVNVVWDLAIHDLSILDYVTGLRPVGVSTFAKSHVEGRPENIAFITLEYENRFVAHVNVNWISPLKVRQIMIGGDKKMAVFNETDPVEKLKIFDKGFDVVTTDEEQRETQIAYRSGDVLSPRLSSTEALALEVQHFVECCKHGLTPDTDSAFGLRMLKILEASDTSMRQKGKFVAIDFGED